MSWSLGFMFAATALHLLCAFRAIRRARQIDKSHDHLLKSARLRMLATSELLNGDTNRAELLAAAGAEEMDRAFYRVGKPMSAQSQPRQCRCGATAVVTMRLENVSGEPFDQSSWCADCATDPEILQALRAIEIQDYNVVRGCQS